MSPYIVMISNHIACSHQPQHHTHQSNSMVAVALIVQLTEEEKKRNGGDLVAAILKVAFGLFVLFD